MTHFKTQIGKLKPGQAIGGETTVYLKKHVKEKENKIMQQ